MAAMMPLAPTREAFPTNPEDFDADDRISYSKTSETYVLEAEDGSEWEFAPKAGKWVAVVRNTPPRMLSSPQRARQPSGRACARTDQPWL